MKDQADLPQPLLPGAGLSPKSYARLLGGLCAALVLAIPLASAVGAQRLDFALLWDKAMADVGQRGWIAAFDAWTGASPADSGLKILFGLRLPRVLLAAVVGAGLGVAGSCFQAALRNPLADPYILGISGGGCLGALLAGVVLGGRGFFGPIVAIAAFVGGAGTLGLVVALNGGWQGRERLLLTGVVVNAVYSAAILFVTSLASPDAALGFSSYLMGRLQAHGLGYGGLGLFAAAVVLGTVAATRLSHKIMLLAQGTDDETRALGLDPDRIRLQTLGIATVLTAVSVAAAGPVGFVGLMVPHAVRLILGNDYRRLLPAAAVLGAVFLIAADAVGRSLLRDHELPVGVVTAFVGGLVFLGLLARHRRKGHES